MTFTRSGPSLFAEGTFAFAVIDLDDPYYVEVYDADGRVFWGGTAKLTDACAVARHWLAEADATYRNHLSE